MQLISAPVPIILQIKKVQPDVYATTPDRTFIFRNWCVICILLLQLTVTVHEAINTTCCINKFALTSIERVRST